MFASKTLEQRNNDPLPWDCHLLNVDVHQRYADNDACDTSAEVWSFDPRPEFQHGKLEANPILVSLRDSDSTISVGEALEAVEIAEYWNGLPDEKDHDPEWSVEQVAHARRVLTLWLAVYGG